MRGKAGGREGGKEGACIQKSPTLPLPPSCIRMWLLAPPLLPVSHPSSSLPPSFPLSPSFLSSLSPQDFLITTLESLLEQTYGPCKVGAAPSELAAGVAECVEELEEGGEEVAENRVPTTKDQVLRDGPKSVEGNVSLEGTPSLELDFSDLTADTIEEIEREELLLSANHLDVERGSMSSSPRLGVPSYEGHAGVGSGVGTAEGTEGMDVVTEDHLGEWETPRESPSLPASLSQWSRGFTGQGQVRLLVCTACSLA